MTYSAYTCAPSHVQKIIPAFTGQNPADRPRVSTSTKLKYILPDRRRHRPVDRRCPHFANKITAHVLIERLLSIRRTER